MRCTLVAKENISYAFSLVEKFLRPAFDVPCDELFDSALKDLFTGDAHLWVAHDKTGVLGAAISRLLILQNKKKICQVVACGGKEMPLWIGCLGHIEKFAKQNDCKALRISGRPGWKLLKAHGYQEPFIILEKGL